MQEKRSKSRDDSSEQLDGARGGLIDDCIIPCISELAALADGYVLCSCRRGSYGLRVRERKLGPSCWSSVLNVSATPGWRTRKERWERNARALF